jgi:hypothetical protein
MKVGTSCTYAYRVRALVAMYSRYLGTCVVDNCQIRRYVFFASPHKK